MKSKFLSIVSAAALLIGASACQDPHEFTPAEYDEQFNSMTASFYDDTRDENSFPAEFDYENHVITIVVPYTYPALSENHLEMSDLTRMRMICNLKNGETLSPALTWLDLSKEHQVTVTDNGGNKTVFTLRAEIRKSKECKLTDFNIPELGLTGIINDINNTVSLITVDQIGEQNAEYSISFGATMSPDPAVELVNFDNEPVLTVTAQDGVTKNEYKVIKANPTKLPFGFRAGSESVVWAKKQADLGVTILSGTEIGAGDLRFNGSAGLGIVGDKLVLNEAGQGKAYVLNYKDGSLIRTIDLTSMGTNTLGQYNNFRMTSDTNGNLLFTSAAATNSGTLTLWKMKGLDGTPEKFATFAKASALGGTLSITGSLDGDAIITSGQNGGGIVFYRWIVKNGVLQSETPDEISPVGYTGNCWGTLDVVYTDASNPESDYLAIGYVGFDPLPPMANGADNRTCAWFDGATNTIKHFGNKCITSNSVENEGDLITFNNTKYYIHNVFNTLGYGYGASLVMYDLSTNDLSTPVLDFSKDGPLNFTGNYGAEAASQTNGKGANGNDVRFFVSPDGFYLYIFFEYSNGYVGAIRLDCIDL